MGTTWAGRLSAASGVLVILAAACLGDEPAPAGPEPTPSASAAETTSSAETAKPAPATAEPTTPAAGNGESKPAAPAGEDRATANPSPKPEGEPAPATATGEAGAVRAETTDRLKRLDAPADSANPAPASALKGLREVLEERLRWLDEWDKVEKARRDTELAEAGAERQAAEIKTDHERVKAQLDQAAKDPGTLLPKVFQSPAQQLTDAAHVEMKEALDAAKGDLKDWKARLEKLRAETDKASNAVAPLRTERDKIHRRVAALKSRGDEGAAAVAAAGTPEEAEIARERLTNFAWEARVETERLQIQEKKIALEATRADLAVIGLQALEAHVHLSTQAFDRMQQRYRLLSELQERSLRRAAASEQKRAARSDDPVEKYKARRKAEFLEMQTQVLKYENALATSPYPALEEQQSLADRAAEDCAKVKRLLDDGRVSHLDALRLNNDFRRIRPERARIKSHEWAAASSQLTYYENALSSVEIELINDSRDDRLQHQDLLDRLPRTLHPRVQMLFKELEEEHLALLERKRSALEKLALRAEQTHAEIERRLKILDDQYGFIRTHIFWVRDEEPIGAATLARFRREATVLGRSLVPLVVEASDRSLWGRISPEFAVAALGLIGLPWPLSRLRRSLTSASSRRGGDPRTSSIETPRETATGGASTPCDP